MAWSLPLIDLADRGTAHPIMPAHDADEGMTGSPAADLPTRRDTTLMSELSHQPSRTDQESDHPLLLRRPHHAPNGAGVKALRPLRGRATPEP